MPCGVVPCSLSFSGAARPRTGSALVGVRSSLFVLVFEPCLRVYICRFSHVCPNFFFAFLFAPIMVFPGLPLVPPLFACTRHCSPFSSYRLAIGDMVSCYRKKLQLSVSSYVKRKSGKIARHPLQNVVEFRSRLRVRTLTASDTDRAMGQSSEVTPHGTTGRSCQHGSVGSHA